MDIVVNSSSLIILTTSAKAYSHRQRIGFSEIIKVVLDGISPPLRFLIEVLADVIDLGKRKYGPA